MELSTLDIYKKIIDSNVKFIDYNYLSTLTGKTTQNTLYKIVSNLLKKDILKTLIDGKYVVSNSNVTDFEIANYIYKPSYISLESALSFYGILSQFPYTITSITMKKSNNYDIGGKMYKYSRIKSEYYNGHRKINNFLIATKEKALFDVIYFSTKGLVNVDFNDLDLTSVDMNTLNIMITDTKNSKMINKLKGIENDR